MLDRSAYCATCWLRPEFHAQQIKYLIGIFPSLEICPVKFLDIPSWDVFRHNEHDHKRLSRVRIMTEEKEMADIYNMITHLT